MKIWTSTLKSIKYTITHSSSHDLLSPDMSHHSVRSDKCSRQA